MRKVVWEEKMKETLLSALRDNLSWELRSILAWKPIVYHFWDEFAESYMQERKKRSIFLYSLRLTQENFDTENHKNYTWYLKQAQHVNSNIDLWFDWIFLWDNIALWFDIENMKITYFDEREVREYQELFKRYWK